MAEEKRHEMMETLFGSEFEGSDDDPDADAMAGASTFSSGDDEAEGGGEADAESERARGGSGYGRREMEAEKAESEAEREESEGERGYSDDGEVHEEVYLQRDRRGRRQVSSSDSEQPVRPVRGGVVVEDDDEVEQVLEFSEPGEEEQGANNAADMRDVFGDSEEEDEEKRPRPQRVSQQSPEGSMERDFSDDEAMRQKLVRSDEGAVDEEQIDQYGSEEEHEADYRAREKPVGPPLVLDVPLRAPPSVPEKMHIVRVSNIMGIESKPFDPKTYIEEETFVTDEAGHKQRIRLEDNVARWRIVRDRDGTLKYESNARFVKWSDGSMQLLIGNEVLDTSIKDGHQDQAHLFVRHGKGLLQAQGRLLRKLQFMPSSLSSKSHRLLTALVDSRHRKMYKVKNVITNIDPEREKEEKEKAVEQRIRSREDLQRRQEKISRKYTPVREREPQLSPGYLEGALEEEEETDDFEGRKTVDARRFQDELEAEGRAERRIINAKRQPPPSREPPRHSREKHHLPSRRERGVSPLEESEQEQLEYESDREEEGINEDEEEMQEEEQAEEEQEDEQEEDEGEQSEEERGRKRIEREEDSEDEESLHRKPVQRRRVVVSDSDED